MLQLPFTEDEIEKRTFLKGLGLKRLKVGQIPAKADPAQQAEFLDWTLANFDADAIFKS